MNLRFLSVCSGIEAASVAFKPLGWRPVGFSEIEPFPCSVLAHHYPNVKNYGDLTKQESWQLPAFDVLCGGTPCQGFSVAGKRGGLADARSQLVWHFLEIARRQRPRWVLWENVPGVLSSEGGADFGAVLGRLGECGYGFAYRVLDAQYFGVAQRRRRVFVVGYLGDWRPAAAVLFERESMSGNPAPRREARERAATYAPGSFGDFSSSSSSTLKKQGGFSGGDGTAALVSHPLKADGFDGFDGSEDGSGRGVPLTVGAIQASYGTGSEQHPERIGDGQIIPDVSPALKQRDHKGPSSDGDGDGAPLIPVAFSGRMRGPEPAVNRPERPPLTMENKVGALESVKPWNVAQNMAVRRLTPRECERLQGFPDDYTLVPHRGKPAADGPRYKALGNSWAVPCARWIGERMALVEGMLAKRNS